MVITYPVEPEPASEKNQSIKLFSAFSSTYQSESKYPIMIVPVPLPRNENRLAKFARFSTHNHNGNVVTISHICKLMQHTDMQVYDTCYFCLLEWKALTFGARAHATHCQQGKCACKHQRPQDAFNLHAWREMTLSICGLI